MRRKLVTAVIVLLLGTSVGLFAAEKNSSTVPWLVSFDSPGTIDLTITGGYTWWGLGLNAGVEFTIGQFNLGAVPLSWGITAQGSAGFDAAGTGIELAGLPTLNVGFDFGKNLKFEAFLGLGLGFVLETWGGGGSGIGIAEYGGATWWFFNDIGLTLEDGYVYSPGWGNSWYFFGIGVTLKI
ncbi:MAG: hypothetical protein ABSG85_08965 [Spirochaetia bacterium]|jgi:hypothetical protein